MTARTNDHGPVWTLAEHDLAVAVINAVRAQRESGHECGIRDEDLRVFVYVGPMLSKAARVKRRRRGQVRP